MSTAIGSKTLVITGAASGFGLEFARLGASRGYNIVMADVEQGALDAAAAEISATGVQVLAQRVDVSRHEQIDALAAATKARFGAPHWVFNNAGVGSGGLIWENTLKDWEWVMGVNVMGVVYGVKAFTPMMLERAKAQGVTLSDTPMMMRNGAGKGPGMNNGSSSGSGQGKGGNGAGGRNK